MCSRFENRVGPDSLNQRYGVLAPLGYHASADIRPDNAILVIDAAGAALRRWGLKAAWDNKLIINARSETVAEKASFRPLLEQRCLIPATAWFEWQQIPGVKRKRRHRLQRQDQQSFCFAGLTTGERVVMLTRAPAREIAHVHDRMPVVLAPEDEERWIDPAAEFESVRGLMDRPGPIFVAEPMDGAPAAPRPQADLFD